MATVTIEDPTITIEHTIHRLENGSYTWSTRTSVTTTGDIQEAAEQAAELAHRADKIARQEVVRRLTGDVDLIHNPEVIRTWRKIDEGLADLGITERLG